MEFEVVHTTHYRYGNPAAEAYGEARLTPLDSPAQTVVKHALTIDPETKTSRYVDHYGNTVDFFSLPYRHQKLVVKNEMIVQTRAPQRPAESLAITVGEARQIFSSALTDIFDYLQPTDIVEIGSDAVQWARKFLPEKISLEEGLPRLNEAIHDSFDYKKGTTDTSTTLSAIWKHREGVCQDFAHIALSVLRTAGLPARYVCGYIEADTPEIQNCPPTTALVGALATHAWIEVLVPGMIWVALDPTNRQWCNERYVSVSFGRDARDATPLRGTFKGSGGQKMDVKVVMKRRAEK
jgi:transglutaminase-like putative cysteine protease